MQVQPGQVELDDRVRRRHRDRFEDVRPRRGVDRGGVAGWRCVVAAGGSLVRRPARREREQADKGSDRGEAGAGAHAPI